MKRYSKDEGVVLWKKNLRADHRLVCVFSRQHGRITLVGYGVRRLTSRRLAHLETGNLIKFSFYKKGDYFYLSETDLVYGYSKTKKSSRKLSLLFLLLACINKITPENQPEIVLFDLLAEALKHLNNRENFDMTDVCSHLNLFLIKSGFVTKAQSAAPYFDPVGFIEELIGQKLKRLS